MQDVFQHYAQRMGNAVSMFGLITLLAALVTLPFTLFDNRIMVQASLNGTGGFSMILDTGASGVLITPEAAQRLHLKAKPAAAISGAGAGQLAASTTGLRDLELGGRRFGRLNATVADLGQIRRAFGFPHLDGVIGFDVLASRYVLVDNDRRTIQFSNDAIAAPANAARSAFRAGSDGLLHVEGAVNGVHGDMILDTGDRSAFTAFQRFAERNNLDAAPLERNVLTGYGVGGPIRGDLLRTHLNVLGFDLADVLTRVPIGRAGVFSNGDEIGSVGNGVLKRFNILYDNVARVMSVWPSRTFATADAAAPPQTASLPRHALFGAALSDTPAGPGVTRVIPQSPAQGAGISQGDALTSIAGVPTASVAAFLSEMHLLHAGQRVQVTYVRNGVKKNADVVLGTPADESDPAVKTVYGAVEVDGSLRRTLVTYPTGVRGKLPALLVMGGIGCYSVDMASDPQDAYMRLTHDVTRSGFVTMRLEKSGVGDSQGPPCRSVDLAAEERGYAAALSALRQDPNVDSARIYLFGHSIGSLEAPRLAMNQSVAGIIIAEAVGRDWPEYETRNLRRQLELGGTPPAQADAALNEKQECLVRLLLERQPEDAIERTMPGCKVPNGVYPVDAPYMQQVAALNIIEPWTRLKVPVLAIYGRSDFVTEEADHQRIVDVVNGHLPSSATLHAIDGMDHYFFVAATPQASLQAVSNGTARMYDTELSRVVVKWLRMAL